MKEEDHKYFSTMNVKYNRELRIKKSYNVQLQISSKVLTYTIEKAA